MSHTKKPLRQMIPEIIQHINNRFESNIELAKEQLNMYSGDIKTPIEASIRKEILSPKSLNVMLERIIPINLLKQTVNKTSQSYNAKITRNASEEQDQEMIDFYIKNMSLDTQMIFSNKMLNLHNYVGLEPYIDIDKTPKLRVLDATRYIPFSDDDLNPTRPTVAIKWMSNINKHEPAVDKYGKIIEGASEVLRNIKLFYVYSSTEWLILDADGDVRQDLMEQSGNPDGTHDIGMVPIIHVNASQYDLVPLQDVTKKDITVSVSKKLTDLSFATLYQSHSMFYGIDVDVSNLDSNPDAFLDIKSESGGPNESTSPQVGILQPKVNIVDTLALIEAEVSLHLKSLGLTIGEGSIGNNSAKVASGVAKMIDEAGAEQLNREQRSLYKMVEERGLWKLLTKLHNIWVAEDKIEYFKGVSDKLEVTVDFSEKKPSESETSIIERIAKKLESGLTSKKRALKEANPDLDDGEIDELLIEIQEESVFNLDSIVPSEEEVE